MKILTQGLLIAATSLSIAYAQPKTALQGGFVEGADVLYYMDTAAMNSSAFTKALEAKVPAEKKAEQEAKQKAFTDATGLTEDDVGAVVLSMDLDNINFQSQDPAQFASAPGNICVELKKSITLDQLAAGVETMKKEEGANFTVTKTTKDGLELLDIQAPPEEKGVKNFYLSLSKDGKAVVGSLNVASLKGGLNRISGSSMAKPTNDMATAMNSMGNKPMRVAVVLPAKAREMLQQSVQGMAAQGGMGAMLMPFATTKSLLVSADMKQNMDVALSLDVGDANSAVQAAGLLQTMAPMLMGNLGAQMGPKAAEIGQRLKFGSNETLVNLNLSLTPEDMEQVPMPSVTP